MGFCAYKDNMTSVQIVGITQPTIPEVSTAEELVAYAARVSNPANQLNLETAPKLLKYLVNNKHWSPFEMVSITMEINTTRDIARQILRHRSFSFQEFSQRYATVEQLGFIVREARLQDKKNRQNSIENTDSAISAEWEFLQRELLQRVESIYSWALNKGIAKEQARAVLPEGLTNSRLYMAGTLRSWIHFIQLRKGNGTQKEHRLVAELALKELLIKFPSVEHIFNEVES